MLGRNERRQQFTVDGIKEGFDSICVEAGGHQDREYLVKDPSQVYPEFLISYRNKLTALQTGQAKIGQNNTTGANSVQGALRSTSVITRPTTNFSSVYGTVPTGTVPNYGPPAPPNNTNSVNTPIGNSRSIAEESDREFIETRAQKTEGRKNGTFPRFWFPYHARV